MAHQWDGDGGGHNPGLFGTIGTDSPPFGSSPTNGRDFQAQAPHSGETYQLFYTAGEGPSGLGLGAHALASLSAANSPTQSPGLGSCPTDSLNLGAYATDSLNLGAYAADSSNLGAYALDSLNLGAYATDSSRDLGAFAKDSSQDLALFYSDCSQDREVYATNTFGDLGAYATNSSQDLGAYATNSSQDLGAYATNSSQDLGAYATSSPRDFRSCATNSPLDLRACAINSLRELGVYSTNISECASARCPQDESSSHRAPMPRTRWQSSSPQFSCSEPTNLQNTLLYSAPGESAQALQRSNSRTKVFSSGQPTSYANDRPFQAANNSPNPATQSTTQETIQWAPGCVPRRPIQPPRETLTTPWLSENPPPVGSRISRQRNDSWNGTSMNGLAMNNNGNSRSVISPNFALSNHSPTVAAEYQENRNNDHQAAYRRELGEQSTHRSTSVPSMNFENFRVILQRAEMREKQNPTTNGSALCGYDSRATTMDTFRSNGNSSLGSIFQNYTSPPAYPSQALQPHMYGASSINSHSPSNQIVRMSEFPLQGSLGNGYSSTNLRIQDPRGPIRRLSFNENSVIAEPNPAQFNNLHIDFPPAVRHNIAMLGGAPSMQGCLKSTRTVCKNCGLVKMCTACLKCHFHYCPECWLSISHRCRDDSPQPLESRLQITQLGSPSLTNGAGVQQGSQFANPLALAIQVLGPTNQCSQARPPGSKETRKCPTHPQYPARFQEDATLQLCCTVCLLKHIGRQPVVRNATPLDGAVISIEYSSCISSLNTLLDDVPKLVNRLIRVDPFEFSVMLQHKVFKEIIELANYNHGLRLLSLMARTNACVAVICEKFLNSEVSKFLIEVNKGVEESRSLQNLIEGPQTIPIVPRSPHAAQGRFSAVSGPALSGLIRTNETTFFYLEIMNSMYVRRAYGDNLVNINIYKDGSPTQVRHTFKPSRNLPGLATVQFTIQEEGNYNAFVRVNGQLVTGTPFTIRVTSEEIIYKTLFEAQRKLGAVQGANENEKGQIQRPWGISTTRRGSYLATDRSLCVIHIIQDFRILRTIGEPGSGQGQLHCPTKAVELVSADNRSYIVVADKDNKRLQILTWEGRFVKETSPLCGLKFPWDLCVTSENVIVCTDNNSNCLFCFNENLQRIGILPLPGIETNARGICNGYLNHIIVTEFHRSQINIMYAPSRRYKPDKKEKTIHKVIYRNNYMKHRRNKGEKQIERFQGVCMDSAGRILFCDSIQNKVRVISYLGEEIASFPVDGQPQGITVVSGQDVAVANLTQGVIDLYDVRE